MSGALKAAKMGVRGGVRPGTGDPGLFGGILGAITGAGRSLVGGGNIIAGAFSGAREGFKGRARAPRGLIQTTTTAAQAFPSPIGFNPSAAGLPVIPTPGVIGAIQRFIPGGATGLQLAQPTAMAAAGGTSMVPFVPKGHHLNKSDYFLRDGSFIAKGTRIVKNRRRDPLNPRALRRAIGRVDAGKIWQGKLSEITTAKFTAGGKRKD